MTMTGHCYCGSLKYQADGDPIFRGQCHCRECQYITGGQPNVTVGVAEAGFRYTQGEPKRFTRSDLDHPVTREFCANCGTHMTTLAPGLPGVVLLKVGTLDDPSIFGKADMAIFTAEKQSFHHLPDNVPCFEGLPPQN